MHAKLTIHNALQTIDSHNVIAKLTGSDPDLKNTYVIYTAHWDHFGIGPEVNGDKIYHGAVDNASGTAALLEMARAYKAASDAAAPHDPLPLRHRGRTRFTWLTILRGASACIRSPARRSTSTWTG